MTETKPLFCPKCKGEISLDERWTVCHRDFNEIPYYEEGFRCLHCSESSMRRDCLTEEQLADQKSWLESLKVPIPSIVEKLSACCLRPESMCECKQSPSFCFAESHESKQSETQNDLSLTDETHSEWIRLWKKQPSIGDKIILRHILTDEQKKAVWNKEDTEMHTIKYFSWEWKMDGEAQNTDWINFSDRKPEVGQWIRAKFDKMETLGTYIKESGKRGLLKLSNLDEGNPFSFTQWKPAQADKESLLVEKQPEECGHDFMKPVNEFIKKEAEKKVHAEEHQAIAKKIYELSVDLDLLKKYIGKPSISYQTYAEDKPQSQIAIEKVIRALKNAHLKYRPMKSDEAFMKLAQELKELNNDRP